MAIRVPAKEPPWRVFLSHTSELSRYPEGDSFIDAAVGAINSTGHVPVDMARFAARDAKPASVCEDKVRDADVYIAVFALRYGTPVRDRPNFSHTELEFETATTEGLPRLVFLLDENSTASGIPASMLYDEYRERQQAFRERVLEESELTAEWFTDSRQLGQLIERALRDLGNLFAESRSTSTEELPRRVGYITAGQRLGLQNNGPALVMRTVVTSPDGTRTEREYFSVELALETLRRDIGGSEPQ
jgi:hypothetical protein